MISPVRLAWIKLSAWLKYGPLWKLSTARYFLFLARQALVGKILIITSEVLVSKGGYKYCSIVISKAPISVGHTYEEFGADEGG